MRKGEPMGLRVSEEYAPHYRPIVSRTTPTQADPIARQLTEEARAIEARGERQAERLGEMISKPVEGFFQGRERAQAQRLREQQSKLAEEQMAQAQLQRQLDEQYGAKTREATLSNLEAQSEAQRVASEEAARRAKILQTIDEETGRTLEEDRLRAPIEQARAQQQMQERQLALSEQQAAINAETAKMQQEQARVALRQMQNAEETKALIGRWQYAETPEEKKAILDAAIQGRNPTVAYDAISQIKDAQQRAELQQFIKAQSDPGYRIAYETTEAARAEQRAANTALSEVDDLIAKLEKAPPFSDESEQAAGQLAQIARDYGLEKDAEALMDMWTVSPGNLLAGENPFQSRIGRAKAMRQRIHSTAANRIENRYSDVQGVSDWARRTREHGFSSAEKMMGGNLFMGLGQPQQGSTLPAPIQPVTPQAYYGTQPPPGPSYGNMPLTAPGSTPQQPMLSEQFLNALRNGQPISQQTAGQ